MSRIGNYKSNLSNMNTKLEKARIANMLVSRRPIIFDIGCNDCADSLELYEELTKIKSTPKFLCFDADQRACEEAAYATDGKPFRVFNLAVSEKEGLIDFFSSDSQERAASKGKYDWSASGSIKKPKEHLELFPEVRFNAPKKVQSTTLDKLYFQYANPFIIDFIWADVNGAEKEVILGGLQALKKTMYLYIEFGEKELYEGQIKQADILNMLPEFELLGVYGFLGNFGNLLLKNKTL